MRSLCTANHAFGMHQAVHTKCSIAHPMMIYITCLAFLPIVPYIC